MQPNASTVAQKSKLKRTRLIVGIVVLAACLRVWAAWQLPVDYDEPTYLDAGYKYAQLIQHGDISGIININENSEHPPLVKLIYGLTFLALGKGVVWDQALFLTRLVSVGFGTLAVLVVALVDPLAGGLFAVQTLVVKYTSQAYLEALPLLMGLLAIILLRRSSTARDKWFLFSAIALGIMGAGKYSYFPLVVIIFYIMIWEKHTRLWDLALYFVITGVAFIGFDPYLWHDPFSRIAASFSFHAQYAEGAHVQAVGYPWYQPFLWVSRSWGFIWHSDVFFYFGFDGLIFLLALPGLWLDWKSQRFVPVWVLTSMPLLLLWPTKWPQYTLVVLPAFCLAASTASKAAYQKLKELDLYWDWLHNMFPRPSKKYIIISSSLAGLLVIGAFISQVLVALNRIGWSSISEYTTGLPSNAVNEIIALKDGRMLIGTDSGAAIWKAASNDEVNDEWTLFTLLNSPIPSQNVLAVAQDQIGTFWFGTAAGLARFDSKSWQIFRASDIGLESDRINTLALDGKGRIWIGTQSGAAVFDGIAWKSYTSETSGLMNNAVFSIAVQPGAGDEQVWFGTLAGVSRLNTVTGQWDSYTRQDIDLGWGGVSYLMFDSTGRLWVCTQGGGISLWDGKTWSTLRVSNSRLPYSTIEAVAELRSGDFWIAASIPNSSGGVRAEFNGSSWRVYDDNSSGYSGAETVSIAEDRSGRYWFGTRTDGIDLYVPRQ
jgi:hypothetical protein